MKNVFSFGEGRADGNTKMRDVLGGKGADLAEMTNLGIPVPPGFTVSAKLCMKYLEEGKLPDAVLSDIKDAMGKLEKETGKRHLQCQLCRSGWTFKRLECPFCGCDEQKKLRYFYDEDDPAYRVEVCDKCRRYLKTVDLRKKDREISLIAEDLATLHLDVVAEQEGFCREIDGA